MGVGGRVGKQAGMAVLGRCHAGSLSGVVGTAANKDDAGRGKELTQQQIGEEKVAEMVDREGGFEPILGVGCAADSLEASVTQEGAQRREGAG